MNFSSKEDVDAPIQHVFAMLSDFDGFERAILRRGAEVQRIDAQTEVGPGMGWDLSFDLRGKERNSQIHMIEYDAPNTMRFEGGGGGMSGTLNFELVALSRTRTRVSFTADLEAKTLSSRLLLQSLKLARSTLNTRLNNRLAWFANEAEERYRSMA